MESFILVLAVGAAALLVIWRVARHTGCGSACSSCDGCDSAPRGGPTQLPLWLVGLGALTLAAPPAAASGRRSTYTHDSSVIPVGEVELEPWTTVRTGREAFYNRYDQRLEFEIGVLENLQTAWYLNFSGLSRDVEGERTSDFEFKGVSWEWKYKLLDPVADPLGLALYFEAGGGPTESELEAKLIVDRRLGDLLLALNLVGEHEWKYEDGGVERELVGELTAAAVYATAAGLALGVEARNHNEWVADEGFAHSVLFVGPAVSFASEKWWAALTLLPQVAALHGATHGRIDLHEHERLEGRLLLGLRL